MVNGNPEHFARFPTRMLEGVPSRIKGVTVAAILKLGFSIWTLSLVSNPSHRELTALPPLRFAGKKMIREAPKQRRRRTVITIVSSRRDDVPVSFTCN
nr:hypothetical protein CFP56_71952 [Quercus suber]